MTHRFAICLATASLLFAIPRPAAAAITTVFDTVDAVELTGPSGSIGYRLIVTGIAVGDSAPTTRMFEFSNNSIEESKMRQCERFAVLVMSKPGKYQFGIGGGNGLASGCKVILRTP